MRRGPRHVLCALVFLAACAVPASSGPADGTWRSLAPPPRQESGRVVHDAVHSRLILFGGYPSLRGDVYELPLAGPRVWRRLPVAGTPPAARVRFSLIDDPTRDRLILFGGTLPNSSISGEVWELSLSGTPTWSPLSPSGGGPGAREAHTAILDPTHDRMVVCGGRDGSNAAHSDVWGLSLAGPAAWELLASDGGITARRGHTAVLDPEGDRMIVFGGASANVPTTFYGDLQAFSLSAPHAWTALVGPGPQARAEHAVAWDPARRQMILSGGGNTLRLSDTWRLSFSPSVAWSSLPALSVSGTPLRRSGHYAVFDPAEDAVIVGDGIDQFGYAASDHALSLANPTAWTMQKFAPSGGTTPAVALDAPDARMLVFEGFGTWAVSLIDEPTWSPILTSGTLPPLRRAAFHDPIRDRMIIVSQSTVWALDLATPTAWTMLAASGASPLSTNAAAVYDPVRDRALLYDGSSANGVWQLSLAGTPTWSPLVVAGSPPSDRVLPALVYEPEHDRLLVFGGVSQNDTWEIPLSGSPAWSNLATAGAPPTSLGAGTCLLDPLRGRLIVLGCGDGVVKALALEGAPTWTTLAPEGTDHPFSSTTSMGAAFDAGHDRIVTYGGLEGMDQPLSFELAFAGVLAAPQPGRPATQLVFSLVAPDPASGAQRFEWSRPAGADASLSIHDLTGRRIWSRPIPEDDRRAVWNGITDTGRAAAPGVYFVSLHTAHGIALRRIVRLR